MSKHRTHRTLWNRLLSGVLCLALVLGLLPAAGLIQTARAESWADPYVEQLIEWGVMTANPNRNLSAAITRAEFVAMCNRAFGYKKLGGTPFIDVPSSAWYAQDIDIAYNAGYFTGTSAYTANPNGTLTREMAAVAVARNLMLQETVGESLGFTDSHELSEWSRGLIGTAVAEGVITGLPDGSFHPTASITWGEVAALLVRLIGTPVNKEGDYELGDVYGNVVISSSNVTLRNTIIAGDLYVTGGVDLGNVLLENVRVLGRIVISGGGEANAAQSSVILRNVQAEEMLVDSIIDQFVTLSAYGITDIPVTYVRTDTWLEDACGAGYGLHLIQLDGENGTKLQLAGNIKEVVNKTPFSDLQLVQGTAQKITVDEYARGSTVLVSEGTLVYEMNLDVATLVTGKGDIKDLNISAAGCVVDILPENVYIRPGITATVDGQEMGSLEASELSSEPRLLAGYPAVTNIAPTQAEGLFAANKPGTVYWAVSELADGSVTVEDLINNPVYGGNIFSNQAGEINASARTEYGRQISSLTPDGSYYLSAVLVDGRGVISPLKVTAFTTPDNTVPAFVRGYPRMSLVSCETAQVTAMPNKNCVLYYALLPEGADAPTANEFKTGSVGGNLGYGSVNVVKNVPVSITVNRSKLQEKTTYWLYLWLTDSNGAQSMATPVRLEFTTPDETPPITSNVMQTGYYTDRADVTFTINEAPSTFYWVVVAEGDSYITDFSDLTAKIKVQNGSGGIVSGSVNYRNANEEVKFTINRLAFKDTQTHNFVMYYIAKDAAGNYSELIGSIPIRTLDTDPPTVQQSFTNPSTDGRPKSDSNIQLTFSEQVKGGDSESAMTFLELYQLVKAAQDEGDAFAESAAKTNLADALSQHIELWYVPKSSTGQQPAKLDKTEKEWGWIDWGEATLEMKRGGSVVLTLTAGTAVSLGSGMTYYFHFNEVYDDAYDPNLLQTLDEDGKIFDDGVDGDCDLPRFTTVYAQVVLTENEDYARSVITVKKEDGTEESVRLDMAFNVIPLSTSNMADTEYWDLIMWGDTWVNFEVYRKVVNTGEGGADDEDWKLIGGPNTYTNFDPASRDGVSLNTIRTDIDSKPQKVKEGLKENTTYIYGIHFTALEGTAEPTGNKRDNPENWGKVVNMEFSVVAGSRSNIDNLSSSIVNHDENVNQYDQYVNVEQAVSEVGLVNNDPAQGNILSLRKTFTDQQAPSFDTSYPRFTNVSSSSFTVEVRLDARPGKLYYVVVPVSEYGAKIGGTVSVDETNDGSAFDVDENGDYKTEDDRDTAIKAYYAANTDQTYIPTSGTDRNKYAEYIYYMTVNADGTKTQDGGSYSDPLSQRVTGARTNFPNYPNSGGAKTLGLTVESFDVTGLDPETEYYVYFVLQGDGLASEVVQIYRVTTAIAYPPVVGITPDGAYATLRTYDGAPATGSRPEVSASVTSVLANSATLPSFFYDTTYSWGGAQYTILEAMITRIDGTPTSKTVFDEYIDSAVSGSGDTAVYAKKDKEAVLRYITTNGAAYPVANRPESGTLDTSNYVAGSAEGVVRDFTDKLPENDTTTEWVVLAVAMLPHAKDSAENYGFAAARGLAWQDPKAPEFQPQTEPNSSGVSYVATVGALRAYTDANCTPGNEVKDWQGSQNNADIRGYYFSGRIRITFDKAVYQATTTSNGRSVRRGVCISGVTQGTPTDTAIHVLDAIYYDGFEELKVTGSGTGAQSVFTFEFTGAVPGATIQFFYGDAKIANSSSSGGVSDCRLTLDFDPLLKEIVFDPDPDAVEAASTIQGGFKATWR